MGRRVSCVGCVSMSRKVGGTRSVFQLQLLFHLCNDLFSVVSDIELDPLSCSYVDVAYMCFPVSALVTGSFFQLISTLGVDRKKIILENAIRRPQ